MKLSTKLAALTPVTVGLLGLTELHYLIRHFATIAEAAAAVTVGTAIWVGKSKAGRSEEKGQESAVAGSRPVWGEVLPPAPVHAEAAWTRIADSQRR